MYSSSIRECGVRTAPAHRAIGRAFVTAVLLTGSTERAEGAVMDAIETWNPGEPLEDALFDRAVRASMGTSAARAGAGETTPSAFPPGLVGVARLSPELRRCFVLRILAGFAREVCASLLHLSKDRIEEHTHAALRQLPAASRRLAPGASRPEEQGEVTMTNDRSRHEQTEELAYLLWQKRGSPMGSPEVDWYRAELELLEEDALSGLPFSTFSMGPVEE